MFRRHHSWLPLIVCLVAAPGAYAAQESGAGKGREETRMDATRKGGPSGGALQRLDPPLQTGEVKVPEGGVDTSGFDPNAGSGFKGTSTPGGGTIQPRGSARGDATGGTGGAPAAAAEGGPSAGRDAARGGAARGERGAGADAAPSGGTTTGGGEASAGARSR